MRIALATGCGRPARSADVAAAAAAAAASAVFVVVERARSGLASVDAVDAFLRLELPVGGRDGALGGFRDLAGLTHGRCAGLDVRSRLSRRRDLRLGTEEQHVGGEETDGARRGRFGSAGRSGSRPAYRHVGAPKVESHGV